MANAIAYRYSSYFPLPIGQYRIGIFKANDDKVPLRVFDLPLQPDAFFTVLMSPGKIDLVNDTLNPKVTTGTILIRNYFPKVTIAVSAGAKRLNPALPYGQSFEASGLPLSSTSLSFAAALADGKKAEAGVDIDLKENKRATVLIIPDSYGRFRARVTFDGKDL
ncbi:MAG: hypothetical protein H0U23_00855 [Blastocatellia bacterium]|nr:hypothetical protein [Blastocatellia bacterium]